MSRAKLLGVPSRSPAPAHLTRLEIRNLATIATLALELRGGFSVFTGETGAGKSIIVDALGLLLGSRSNPDLIRSGADDLLVTGFWGEDVVSRKLTHQGRSSARVDGEVVALRELAEVSQARLTIHWQHSAQSLLSAGNQRALLDSLLLDELGHYHAAYRAWQNAAGHFERLQASERERARQLDLLRFQTQELSEAGLKEGEEEPLRAELVRLSNFESIAAGASEALELLSDGEISAAGLVSQAIRSLNAPARYDEASAQLQAELASALESVQAVVSELRSVAEDRAPDPEALAQLESRLSLIGKLQAKYGPSSQDVLNFQVEAERELAALESDEQSAGTLEAEVRALRQIAEQAGLRLRTVRQKAAAPLSEQLLNVIRQLGMPHARLEFELRPLAVPGPHGSDDVSIRFSANPGEGLGELADTASGGELSRVMLAISTVLGASTPSVVFDEVDAGIGGSAARAVADQLSHLASARQVLVVTHLAQIAARADWHFKVEKDIEAGRTISRVRLLSGEERLEEIARMLSGASSEAALLHARELLAGPKRIPEPKKRGAKALS
ncbi:DNA repair protein RecN [Deinococcus detaillensis]|uniref:DNA repair protein RecN n=1 Tax=Deinococcus detaillensis TaxID=2592048 RepID=A0A553ULJ5_9DEIO|nr:DNA repair protein RecN [Deinococcus detaillensis]TSA81079.1 DNA repair protein RecN [Deinococcus detaillensis]